MREGRRARYVISDATMGDAHTFAVMAQHGTEGGTPWGTQFSVSGHVVQQGNRKAMNLYPTGKTSTSYSGGDREIYASENGMETDALPVQPQMPLFTNRRYDALYAHRHSGFEVAHMNATPGGRAHLPTAMGFIGKFMADQGVGQIVPSSNLSPYSAHLVNRVFHGGEKVASVSNNSRMQSYPSSFDNDKPRYGAVVASDDQTAEARRLGREMIAPHLRQRRKGPEQPELPFG